MRGLLRLFPDTAVFCGEQVRPGGSFCMFVFIDIALFFHRYMELRSLRSIIDYITIIPYFFRIVLYLMYGYSLNIFMVFNFIRIYQFVAVLQRHGVAGPPLKLLIFCKYLLLR